MYWIFSIFKLLGEYALIYSLLLCYFRNNVEKMAEMFLYGQERIIFVIHSTCEWGVFSKKRRFSEKKVLQGFVV